MELYGFKPVELGPKEYVYDLEHNKIAEYKMCEREGYPYYCYFKYDLNGNPVEAYPLMIHSIKESLAIFKNEQPYIDGFSLKKYAYFSFDNKNPIADLYIDNKDHLRKFRGGKLELIYDFFKIEEAEKFLSKEECVQHLNWLGSLDASMIGISRKDGELYKFSTIKENPEVGKLLGFLLSP